MNEGFEGTAASFLVFFRACRMFKINTESGRIELLRKLAARKSLKYHRDGDSFLQGKNVLKIKRKEDLK